MSTAPAPSPQKRPGLSAREMLLVGLAAMFVGELYWNSSGAAPTWPLHDAPDPRWFDWPFSPPVFGWVLSIVADGLSRLAAFLGPRAAALEAKLEPRLAAGLEAAEASLEERVEAILHARGLRRAAPPPGAIAAEPASPVMPVVAPSSQAASLPEATKNGH